MDQSTSTFWQLYAQASKTAVGFFWKAGWAFVLGYGISAIIQTFIPKGKLTPYLGKANAKSISLSTLFGTISSSCSFAALATARSLFLKGANFISTVAFMFASTNLVLELGILILIFLGWQYLVAEIIGGILLIIISSILIKLTYPQKLIDSAKEKVKNQESSDADKFDWKKRIKSKEGWLMVGKNFVSDWKMVWEEILIGFSIAGFISVFVPNYFWENIFLQNMSNTLPNWLILIENALVSPFVAASTFIGSMGNIPLATILNNNGILFAGIIGFIYSDLMVPPLIMINAKYYGKKIALYIAAIMYVSIVITALVMQALFESFSIIPESAKKIAETTQFKIDYTFFLNICFIIITGLLVWLNKKFHEENKNSGMMNMSNDSKVKKIIALSFAFTIAIGLILNFLI